MLTLVTMAALGAPPPASEDTSTEGPEQAEALPTTVQVKVKNKHPGALAMRTVGQVVAVPGIALGVGGAALIVGGLAGAGSGDCDVDCGLGSVIAIVGGVYATVLATPFLAVGTPLWAVGHVQHRENKRQKALSFHPTDLTVLPLAKGQPGLTLGGRF